MTKKVEINAIMKLHNATTGNTLEDVSRCLVG